MPRGVGVNRLNLNLRHLKIRLVTVNPDTPGLGPDTPDYPGENPDSPGHSATCSRTR